MIETQPEGQEPTAKFDRDELVRGWRVYENHVPRLLPILKFSAKTDMGQVRENNEDKFDFYEPEEACILAERGSIYAVADGIGGAVAGQIASEMTLKQVISGYYDNPSSDIVTALRESVIAANDRIHALAQMIPERRGMGATLVAAVFIEDKALIAHVGDSRAYRMRNGKLEQITHDHSWVEEQVRAGAISRSEAEMSPFKNVITRSVGATQNVAPDFCEDTAVPGDTYLLCSDGLTGHVKDDEIAKILSEQSPSEAARQLIELANARGGKDNITVFILSLRALIPYSESAFESNSAQPSSSSEPGPVASSWRNLLGLH